MASKKELRALITLAGKIDPSLQAAMMKASKLNMKVAKESQKSAGMMSKVGTIAKGVLVGNLLTKGVSMLAEGITSVGRSGIQLASDLTEVQNVVDVTFGEGATQINNWSKKALKSFGLAELQAKKYNGTLGALLKSSGITGNNLLVMSENLSGLAGDFASFYNLAQDDAFDKIRAGISGETEPLKQLGINMSVANMEAFALSKGIKTSWSKMDQATQTILRYSYLMEKSKDAQGDFARTQGGFANQTRLLKTTWDQLTATIASKSLPLFTKLAQKGNELLGGIDAEKLGQGVAEKLGAAFDIAAKYIPIIIDGAMKIPPIVSEIYDKGKWVSDLIVNNWSMIEPVVWGIAGAVGAYKIAMAGLVIQQKAAMIIEGLNKAWAVGSAVLTMFQSGASLATVAQWALNAAMTANPIGLVVVGIGALIAAGVLLYKNWDTITAALSSAWNWFQNLIKSISDFAFVLTGPIAPILLLIKHFDAVKNAVGGAIDSVKNFFGLSGSKSDNPSNVSGKDLVSSNIKGYASGGFASEPSIFGEVGLEAAIPIKYRNPRSISLLNQTARAIGAAPSGEMPGLHLSINFYGPVSNQNDVVEGVKMAKDYIIEVIDEYKANQGRVSFG